MYRFTRLALVAAIVAPLVAAPALAQSSDNPNSGDVSRQFSSGADRVAEGATQIGKGIAQGAVLTWHAIKDGANAFANRIGGGHDDKSQGDANAPGSDKPGPDQSGPPKSSNPTQ